jgi:GxxExxY protein
MEIEIEHGLLRIGDERLPENRVATSIIGAAIEVQKHLGPGLLETAYETALCYELELRGLTFTRQTPVAVRYKDVTVLDAYRADLIVADSVIVEIKAIDNLIPIHEAQLLTYLRFAGKRLGLLFNFHALPLKAGMRRVVNHL